MCFIASMMMIMTNTITEEEEKEADSLVTFSTLINSPLSDNTPFEQYSNTETTPLSVNEELTYLLLDQKDAADQPQDYTVPGIP